MSKIPVISETRILPFASVRRERILPTRGEVTVSIGMRVEPLDVIATALPGRLRPIPLARYMQDSETALTGHLLKKAGDLVQAREIIASKSAFMGMQRIYRAPGDGRIAAIQGSWMTIELSDEPIELRALYRGSIVNVMPRLGVVIEAAGALIQGAFSLGSDAYGTLKRVADDASAILTEEKFDVSARGAVLLGGAGVTEGAIQRAMQEHAAGIIVGGLSPQLRGMLATANLPILVTEGWGEHPMAAQIFQLLSSHDGNEISIIPAMSERSSAGKPEAFIPARTSASASALPALNAQVGARVRLLAPPRRGETGKIAEIPTTPLSMESGVSTFGAYVEIAPRDRVFVPWENLELMDG